MNAIAIIANPHAKSGPIGQSQQRAIQQSLQPHDKIFWSQDLEQLRSQLRQIEKQDFAVLAIRGGDGTLRLVLHEALAVWNGRPLPPILLLRGGTMNVVAASIHIRGTTQSILRRFRNYANMKDCPSVELPLLKVNQYYGFILGGQCLSNFLKCYYEQGASPTTAGKLALRLALSMTLNGRFSQQVFTPMPITHLVCDGQNLPPGNYSLLAASVVQQAGLGMAPFHYAQKSADRFHLLMSAAKPRTLLRYLPRLFRGQPSRQAQLLEWSATKVELQFKVPCAIALDGELLQPCQTLALELGPKVRMLTAQ